MLDSVERFGDDLRLVGELDNEEDEEDKSDGDVDDDSVNCVVWFKFWKWLTAVAVAAAIDCK